jgi:signal transduction histidine kinase
VTPIADRAQVRIMERVSLVRSRRTAAALITAAVALWVLAAAVSLWAEVADHRPMVSAVLVIAFMLAYAVVGAVVAGARPANRVGWVMLVGALLSVLGEAGTALAHHGIVAAPGSVAGASAYAVAGSASRSLGWYVLTLALPAVFPAGSLPASGWRWLRVLLPAVLVASVVGPLTDAQADDTELGRWTNPIALHGALRVVESVAFFTQVPLGLVTAGGIVALLVARWRRGDALLRQQLLLFVVAAAIPIVAVPLVFATGYGVGPWVFGLTALPLPVAIGFAVLARGLYDLRTAVNRTLVWTALSAVVAGLYALAIAGLGNRLGSPHATWLPWVAAGVVSVSFAPLRDTLQRGVNRLTFGRWEQPYDVLAALGQRLEASADVPWLLDRLVDELHGLGLREVAVTDARGVPLAGEAVGAERVELPLTAFGARVGSLSYLAPAAVLRTRDRQLLDDLAGHLGGVLHAHELTLDLQRARERLVLAREEERRRLRRDLHDGLGPSLAGHLLRLDVLAGKLGRHAAAADVDELREDLRATMLDVRRVVEGLRPPALDELGLGGAVQQVVARLTAGSATEVAVDVEVLPPLPAAVEVAAYRIVTEAVTNVVRHAGASRCDVRIAVEEDALVLEISDDGDGGVLRDGGNGLQTMRERAEELTGQLRITSGNGTVVSCRLPLPRPTERTPRPSSTVTS